MVRTEGDGGAAGDREAQTRRAADQLPDPRAILNSIGEVVYDWDIGSDRLRWGANVCEVLGLDDAGLLDTGISLAGHLAPESPGNRYEAVMAACERDCGSGAAFQVQYGLVIPGQTGRGDDKGRTWIEDKGRVFAGPDRRPTRAHGIIRVITERFESERQLAFRSIFDPLTGALNRANITGHIARMFAQSARNQSSFALLMVDIRDLADINHRHGYDVADELIGGVAGRMRANMRATDVLGRYSGNKFAMVLDACNDEQMLVAARRLMQSVEEAPVPTSAGPLQVSLHVGCTMAPRHARQTQPLLQHAEEALAQARSRKLRQPLVFAPNAARDEARRRALRMSDDIIAALNERRIALAFQPVVQAGSHLPMFYEALLRLRRPDGSLASPGEVLPLAEQSGLIVHLDHRVLELALARLAGEPALRLAINVAAATIHDPAWPQHLSAALRMSPGTGERLLVEIAETCVAEDAERTGVAVRAMKELGVRVALDHFGAGHLSFRHLRPLGFDLLKIDGAFMQNLEGSPDDRFFVRTLIELAAHLGIPTVAEWVENAASARILGEWGVDFLQGFHFGMAGDLAPLQRASDATRVA